MSTRAAVVILAAAVNACERGSPPEEAAPIQPQGAPTADFELSAEQQAFVEDLSRRTFDYFWQTTDPDTCLAPDRWPSAPFSSIAAVGFALTAYGIGAERGYVSREEAAQRTLKCLDYLYGAPQGPDPQGVIGYQGFYYHFIDMESGTRHDASELSTVDTSLFLAGALFAQSYYDSDTEVETAIRERADEIYRRVDWTHVLRSNSGTQARNLPDSRGITMGWRPEKGFESHDWVGYNEGMLVYVLALGSPTHPVTRDAWDNGWAAQLEGDWGEYYGQEHLTFEPLFGHQYSHIWIDFRGIRDDFMRGKGIDYFENSRRATLSQYAYAQDNPQQWVGYGGDIWGLTACDGPGPAGGYEVSGEPRRFWGYAARGASPSLVRDDGTIAPTAAGGSIPFAPEIAIPALMAMKEKYGHHLYTEYGFRDAFNASFVFTDEPTRRGEVVEGLGWIADDHIGIDQGPILAMLENYRSELVWRTMRKNQYILQGLRAIGFTGGWLQE